MKFGRKAVAIIWLEILAGIFVIGLFYVIWSWVLYAKIQPIILPQIAAANSSAVDTTQVQNTINLVNMVWTYWPLILIFGLILYGIVASQRREPQESWY